MTARTAARELRATEELLRGPQRVRPAVVASRAAAAELALALTATNTRRGRRSS